MRFFLCLFGSRCAVLPPPSVLLSILYSFRCLCFVYASFYPYYICTITPSSHILHPTYNIIRYTHLPLSYPLPCLQPLRFIRCLYLTILYHIFPLYLTLYHLFVHPRYPHPTQIRLELPALRSPFDIRSFVCPTMDLLVCFSSLLGGFLWPCGF
ncbi:hypothetical protein GYMLUDRAFT_959039 [Collybiopsis luxurians FD-317 M1]|nr:hypothetical protein GYMLUDRAFT_959039 [Collybiopsis luxurians FD-317 M1]